MIFSTLIVLIVILSKITTIVFSSKNDEIITLYKASDSVIELFDENITSIYDSEYTWIVEFYAHWCGHCQRFKPYWIEIAQQFDKWNGTVKIASVNCAVHNCNDFYIRGTPTIRGFAPNTVGGTTIGTDISIGGPPPFQHLVPNILTFIEFNTDKGLLDAQSIPNLVPYRYHDFEEEWKRVKYSIKNIVFIFEKSLSDFGSLMIYRIGSSESLHLRRVNADLNSFMRMAFPLKSLPALVILNKKSHIRKPDSIQYYFVDLNSPNPLDEAEDYLSSISNSSLDDGAKNSESNSTSEWEPWIKVITEEEENSDDIVKDLIYESDLENAIKYSIFTEIPLQSVMDEPKILTLYSFLEVLTKYLPLRPNILNFLRSLKEWPIIMNIRILNNDQYMDKVMELNETFAPFEDTPNEWVACKGSKSYLRGYPCSLWTLFHTLTVNSESDSQFKHGGSSSIAMVMTNYIHHFFSCRHCAQNFEHKVESIGQLPTSHTHTILWLWQIHNRANRLLKGDTTEDPKYPKIIWPSRKNCPNCRGQDLETFILVDGVFWNSNHLVNYLKNVYKTDNIIMNVKDNQKIDKKSKAMKFMNHLENMKNMTDDDDDGIDDLIKKYCGRNLG